MNIFGHDWSFWVALSAAIAVRVASSPFLSIWRALIMVVGSLVMALAFVDPALDWLRLDPAIYKTPVAILLAFTADGVLRMLVTFSTNPKELLEFLRAFRGGTK